jgi:hypothetical protein
MSFSRSTSRLPPNERTSLTPNLMPLGVDAQLLVEEIKSEVKRVVPPLTGILLLQAAAWPKHALTLCVLSHVHS